MTCLKEKKLLMITCLRPEIWQGGGICGIDLVSTGELEPTGRDGPSRRDLVSALKQPMKNSPVSINYLVCHNLV